MNRAVRIGATGLFLILACCACSPYSAYQGKAVWKKKELIQKETDSRKIVQIIKEDCQQSRNPDFITAAIGRIDDPVMLNELAETIYLLDAFDDTHRCSDPAIKAAIMVKYMTLENNTSCLDRYKKKNDANVYVEIIPHLDTTQMEQFARWVLSREHVKGFGRIICALAEHADALGIRENILGGKILTDVVNHLLGTTDVASSIKLVSLIKEQEALEQIVYSSWGPPQMAAFKRLQDITGVVDACFTELDESKKHRYCNLVRDSLAYRQWRSNIRSRRQVTISTTVTPNDDAGIGRLMSTGPRLRDMLEALGYVIRNNESANGHIETTVTSSECGEYRPIGEKSGPVLKGICLSVTTRLNDDAGKLLFASRHVTGKQMFVSYMKTISEPDEYAFRKEYYQWAENRAIQMIRKDLAELIQD